MERHASFAKCAGFAVYSARILAKGNPSIYCKPSHNLKQLCCIHGWLSRLQLLSLRSEIRRLEVLHPAADVRCACRAVSHQPFSLALGSSLLGAVKVSSISPMAHGPVAIFIEVLFSGSEAMD